MKLTGQRQPVPEISSSDTLSYRDIVKPWPWGTPRRTTYDNIVLKYHLIQTRTSDVKRGQNLEAEAKTSRPRPRPELRGRGRGKSYEAKAEAKNNSEKKYQIMINNIRFKIIAWKLTKFPNFTRFLPENAQLHNKTTRSRPGWGQMFEAEAKILASRT